LITKGLKKAGNAFAGVPEEVTDKYLRNADEVMNERGTIESVKNEIDDLIVGMKNNKNQIVDDLSATKEAMRDRTQQIKDGLADRKYATSLSFDEAKSKFTQEAKEAVEALENKTVAPLREKIFYGMEELKSKVSYSSGEAFGLLDQ